MKKNSKFVRIMCWILAGLMVSGVATTLIMFIISGLS